MRGGGGGGKGGVVSQRQSTTDTPTRASVIMALCEGPIAGISQIWKDQTIYTLGRTRV